MVISTQISHAEEFLSKDISPQSEGVMSNLCENKFMSKQEIGMQATGGKDVKEVNLFNEEVDDK